MMMKRKTATLKSLRNVMKKVLFTSLLKEKDNYISFS